MTTIEVKGNSVELVTAWLSLWQGVIGFTGREKELLTVMLIEYSTLKSKGLIEPYLTKELLSTESRRMYCNVMEITNYNLTNLLSSLKDKGIIRNDQLDLRLVPQDSIGFKFILNENK